MNHGKKLTVSVLCLCIFFIFLFSACAEKKEPQIPVDDGYKNLTQVFSENASALEMLQTVDSCLTGIAKASVEKYTEALITAMVTYDMQHALQVAEQYKTENLQIAKKNNFEFDTTTDAIRTTMMNMDNSTAVFKEKLSFLPGKAMFDEYPIEWIYSVSEIETVMQNYSLYHTFLKNIADNTVGALQNAAQNVQNSMQHVAEKRDFFGDAATGFGGTSAFFFASRFFSYLQADERDQTLVDTVLSTLASVRPVEATPIPIEEDWKQAYWDWIESQNFASDYCEFALINLNNDNIPELYQSYSEYDSTLCSYMNGTFLVQDNLEIIFYLEGTNYFLSSGGRMDYYHDKVYSLENGNFTLHHTGQFGYIDTLYPNKERIYDYYWDGEKMNESQYKEELQAAFDEDTAICLLYDGVSYREIVNQILLYE